MPAFHVPALILGSLGLRVLGMSLSADALPPSKDDPGAIARAFYEKSSHLI